MNTKILAALMAMSGCGVVATSSSSPFSSNGRSRQPVLSCPASPAKKVFTAAMCLCGDYQAVGEGVTAYKVGDKVVAATPIQAGVWTHCAITRQSGNLTLYCPADENKDVKQDFQSSGEAVNLPVPGNRQGAFDLQVNWQADGATYYFEKKITL
mgnify:CR=1 FL=1